MTELQVTAHLRPCPECKTPMVITNGEVSGSVTMWSDGGQPCITPHRDGCGLAGKAVPPLDWGIGPYETEEQA